MLHAWRLTRLDIQPNIHRSRRRDSTVELSRTILNSQLVGDCESLNQSINQRLPKYQSYFNVNCKVYKRLLVQMIMSGYDFPKSQVLSCWRKVESDFDVVICSGRVFQTWGPATVNARSPTVERLTDGTIRRLVPPEPKLLRCMLWQRKKIHAQTRETRSFFTVHLIIHISCLSDVVKCSTLFLCLFVCSFVSLTSI